MSRLIYIVLFGSLLCFSSCDEEPISQTIPYAFVNQDINLNLIQYQDLQNLGGYYVMEQGQNSGYRGLIIYHEGNGVYRVFERACTYDPNSECDPIDVDDSGLFLIHECCNSTFDFRGNPTGGPASLHLLQYTAIVDGIFLKIRNQ